MVARQTLTVQPLRDEDIALFVPLATGLGQGRLSGNRERLIALGALSGVEPAGLLLAEIRGPATNQYLEVLTLRVQEQFRRRGLATQLLSEAETLARFAGCQLLTGLVADGSPDGPAARALAARAGWIPFRLTRTVYKSPYPTVGNSHWAGRKQPWPEDFEVFPWRDLTEEERNWLLARRNDSFHFDPAVSPFKGNRECTQNSVGLRVKGEIAGWAVSWPLSSTYSTTMTGTRVFVRGDLQRRGYGVFMIVEHFQRGTAAGIDCAIFSVAPDNKFMLRFMKRHFWPYVSDFREIWEMRKVLTSGRHSMVCDANAAANCQSHPNPDKENEGLS